MIPSLLRASSIALMVSSSVALGACAASSRQRPVGMGDVSTGTESLAATRKQLEGTWTLTRFEVADNTGQLITVRAKAQLTYDAYGNLSIRGVLEEPLPGQKTVTEAPALAYTGKAVIDTARKEMVLTGTSASTATNSYARSIIASAITDSSIEKCCPMQARGPPPKGNQA